MKTKENTASGQDSDNGEGTVKTCQECKFHEATMEVLQDTYGPVLQLCQRCYDRLLLEYPARRWLKSLTAETLRKIPNAVEEGQKLVIYAECAYCCDLVPIDETDDHGLCNSTNKGRDECCSGQVHLCVECLQWISDENEWSADDGMCKSCSERYAE